LRLFPPELEIPPNEGFAPEKDIFGRKPFGDQLTRIVRALEGPSVLLLDSPWGSGKSIFVKMWRGELIKAGVPSIYFDAFANDYQEDAFLAVASQIIAEADTLKPASKKAFKTFKEQAIRTAKILGRASLKIGVRAASAGLVEGEDLEKAAAEIVKDAGDETASVVDEVLREQLESHESDRRAFESFKEALKELSAALSKKLSAQKKGQESSSNEEYQTPLIFIIDELDRCRPSFALEILEKIKHFYSVPNVIFMLVSSLSQLETAVRFAYGDIDARTYLEKFYHLRVLLPGGRIDRPDMGTETYLRYLGCNQNVSDLIELFSQTRPLSFRTLERIASYAQLLDASMARGSLFLPQIISVLCILKVIRPDLYEAARKSKITFQQVNEVMDFNKWRHPHDPEKRHPAGIITEQWWRLALGESSDEDMKRREEGLWNQYNMRPNRVIPYFCDLLDGFAFPA
jgi:KAP family P-loop domain